MRRTKSSRGGYEQESPTAGAFPCAVADPDEKGSPEPGSLRSSPGTAAAPTQLRDSKAML